MVAKILLWAITILGIDILITIAAARFMSMISHPPTPKGWLRAGEGLRVIDGGLARMDVARVRGAGKPTGLVCVK